MIRLRTLFGAKNRCQETRRKKIERKEKEKERKISSQFSFLSQFEAHEEK